MESHILDKECECGGGGLLFVPPSPACSASNPGTRGVAEAVDRRRSFGDGVT